ncbi:MAG TPA: TOBE domain-containing protein, partial [Mycoplana sp.]|nr:TOBE domain-containing protein [Mycoplana sp.]
LAPQFVESLGYPARYASLRPEALSLGEGGADRKRFSGTVVATSFLGAANRITVEAVGSRVAAMIPASVDVPSHGSGVTLSFAAEDLHLMDEAA